MGVCRVVVPEHGPAAERRMALADHLAEVVHAPGEAAPVAGEHAEVDDRMRRVVVPEAGVLADDLVLPRSRRPAPPD